MLDERIKSSDLSMPALLGTMLHQLFQVLLSLFFGWFYWQIRLGETLGKPRGIRILTHCTYEFLEMCFGELLYKKIGEEKMCSRMLWDVKWNTIYAGGLAGRVTQP